MGCCSSDQAEAKVNTNRRQQSNKKLKKLSVIPNVERTYHQQNNRDKNELDSPLFEPLREEISIHISEEKSNDKYKSENINSKITKNKKILEIIVSLMPSHDLLNSIDWYKSSKSRKLVQTYYFFFVSLFTIFIKDC